MATTDDERKRTLYISSENVDYFRSSERVTINLNQTMQPQDGYILTYALKSIGFDSTAMNISERQKNNKISFLLEYDDSDVLYVATKATPDGPIDAVTTVANSAVKPLSKETVTIIVPDGHYTFTQLLEFLSTTLNYTICIPSGYYYDYEKNIEDYDNIVNVRMEWIETRSGFLIAIDPFFIDVGKTFVREYVSPLGITFPISELFSKLSSVSVVPTLGAPNLFNLLFTNYNTEYEDTPISIRPDSLKKGLNPHQGVKFSFTIDNLNSFYDLTNIVTTELGNEHIYDLTKTPRLYPTQEKINYHRYQAFYKPTLDPSYIDIVISLPNSALDERGHRNILSRLFTLGSKSGGSSFFQMWENPKVTVLRGLSGFSSITLNIESQENKWNFFNLEFSIELEISEIKEEDPEDVHDMVDLNIPVTDSIADAAAKAGPRHPQPLSSSHFSYRKGGIHTHKRTRHI